MTGIWYSSSDGLKVVSKMAQYVALLIILLPFYIVLKNLVEQYGGIPLQQIDIIFPYLKS